jgi:DegV family protein with EDD domain
VIALVTDSNSQIPPALVDRYGVTVVPLPVTVDGTQYLEGVDLDADAFWARFRPGAPPPRVATAQPSPGQFAETYGRLVEGGAEAVLSVHIGSTVSGTINSARLAAAACPVPVRIVDTDTASFAIALCTWAAGDVIASGGTLDDAAQAAERVAATAGNVFVVRALDLARAGGRLAPGADRPDHGEGVPVLSMVGGVMQVVGTARDHGEVADVMAAHIGQAGANLRVGIGVADRDVAHLWDELEARLRPLPGVAEVVRYRVGPSVGAHTGPGTVGAMYAPAPAVAP